MNRIAYLLTIVCASLVALPATSRAQNHLTPPFAEPVGFHLRSSTDPRPEASERREVKLSEGDEPRPALYILTGAAIGAIAAGVAAGIALSDCNDCMMAGPVIVLGVGAAAVVGGAAGLLVYAWRKEDWVDPAKGSEQQPAR